MNLCDKWETAYEHLVETLSSYLDIGSHGQLAIQVTFKPLITRLASGERTSELYDAIMALE